MKKFVLVTGICLLLISMPVGLTTCDCKESDDSIHQQSTTPWLSATDIAALEEQGKTEGWTFTVGKNTATDRPFSQLCGLVEPNNWWENASFDPCLPTKNLPSHFDWRELGGCPPVRDQGPCGSCWAFGTVAPLECNILIKDHKEVDLSEQWLVSCNRNGWGCNGGWWAHDYHQWKMDRFNGTGAVLEGEFPYEAWDVPCDGPYEHPYVMDSWHYIGFSQGVPPTDAIKQAILTYGPVSVSCAVTGAFGAYTGGVFNEDDPHAQINHAIALVGWDDSQGADGVWFLRNSWGPGWGEDGYMRIEYGVCKVGYAACYVNYPVKTKIEITGGLFGVSVGFRNLGNTTTTEVKWNITLKGGFLDMINTSLQSTIASIEPGTVVYQRLPRLGFGHLDISVTATPKNAGKTTKHAEGFLCGLLLFVPQNQ
jgi:C1A family cysteine protease